MIISINRTSNAQGRSHHLRLLLPAVEVVNKMDDSPHQVLDKANTADKHVRNDTSFLAEEVIFRNPYFNCVKLSQEFECNNFALCFRQHWPILCHVYSQRQDFCPPPTYAASKELCKEAPAAIAVLYKGCPIPPWCRYNLRVRSITRRPERGTPPNEGCRPRPEQGTPPATPKRRWIVNRWWRWVKSFEWSDDIRVIYIFVLFGHQEIFYI